MTNHIAGFLLTLGILFIPFKDYSNPSNLIVAKNQQIPIPTKKNGAVYKTESLVIKKLSNHIYEHISFLKTDDFGKVACNGMIVINKNKAIVFDTPTDEKGSTELIEYLNDKLTTKIIAIIPTHFHEDCVGGLTVFEKKNIQLYVSNPTLSLLKQNGQMFSKPVIKFNKQLDLDLAGRKVYAQYFGEGHTKDNVIGYSPMDNAIFGGCLIKTVGAKKGYLGDANINLWSETVEKIKSRYPKVEIVIPGHGKPGGSELLEYTIELFE